MGRHGICEELRQWQFSSRDQKRIPRSYHSHQKGRNDTAAFLDVEENYLGNVAKPYSVERSMCVVTACAVTCSRASGIESASIAILGRCLDSHIREQSTCGRPPCIRATTVHGPWSIETPGRPIYHRPPCEGLRPSIDGDDGAVDLHPAGAREWLTLGRPDSDSRRQKAALNRAPSQNGPADFGPITRPKRGLSETSGPAATFHRLGRCLVVFATKERE